MGPTPSAFEMSMTAWDMQPAQLLDEQHPNGQLCST
jgi:hypothetical protein